MNAMQDMKHLRSPGYTGNRHDDKPETLTKEQVGILSFVAGMLVMMTVTLVVGA
jgi:hypothetical protein